MCEEGRKRKVDQREIFKRLIRARARTTDNIVIDKRDISKERIRPSTTSTTPTVSAEHMAHLNVWDPLLQVLA